MAKNTRRKAREPTPALDDTSATSSDDSAVSSHYATPRSTYPRVAPRFSISRSSYGPRLSEPVRGMAPLNRNLYTPRERHVLRGAGRSARPSKHRIDSLDDVPSWKLEEILRQRGAVTSSDLVGEEQSDSLDPDMDDDEREERVVQARISKMYQKLQNSLDSQAEKELAKLDIDLPGEGGVRQGVRGAFEVFLASKMSLQVEIISQAEAGREAAVRKAYDAMMHTLAQQQDRVVDIIKAIEENRAARTDVVEEFRRGTAALKERHEAELADMDAEVDHLEKKARHKMEALVEKWKNREEELLHRIGR